MYKCLLKLFFRLVQAIANCRSTEIQCLTKSIVKGIVYNVNEFKDFNNMPLLIGQIPLPLEFEMFWKLIDKVKVDN